MFVHYIFVILLQEASILDMENRITVENLEVDKLQRLCDKETMIVQKQEDSIDTQCSNEYGSISANGRRLVKFVCSTVKTLCTLTRQGFVMKL